MVTIRNNVRLARVIKILLKRSSAPPSPVLKLHHAGTSRPRQNLKGFNSHPFNRTLIVSVKVRVKLLMPGSKHTEE